MRKMNKDQRRLIEEAVAALEISEIALVRSMFDRPGAAIESDKDTVDIEQQMMMAAHVQDDDDRDVRRVLVKLGVRMVESGSEPENVLFVIEATYGVEYRVVDDLSDEAMRLFASKNSIHNVWPFWRQHVFDIVQRGYLPKIDVPFFTMDLDEQEQNDVPVSAKSASR